MILCLLAALKAEDDRRHGDDSGEGALPRTLTLKKRAQTMRKAGAGAAARRAGAAGNVAPPRRRRSPGVGLAAGVIAEEGEEEQEEPRKLSMLDMAALFLQEVSETFKPIAPSAPPPPGGAAPPPPPGAPPPPPPGGGGADFRKGSAASGKGSIFSSKGSIFLTGSAAAPVDSKTPRSRTARETPRAHIDPTVTEGDEAAKPHKKRRVPRPIKMTKRLLQRVYHALDEAMHHTPRGAHGGGHSTPRGRGGPEAAVHVHAADERV